MKIATAIKTLAGIVLLIAVGIVINNETSGPGAADFADHAKDAIIEVQRGGPCSASDIAVDKLRAQGTHVTGRLVNNCAVPVGAQIKITTYDKAGSILSVDDIWPASVGNIPAHSDFPFEWLLTKSKGVATFTVVVTRVKVW